MINSNSTGFAVVFGGSGFIGNFLVEELMDKGYEVLNADLIESENSRAGFIKCDVRRPISIALDRRPDMVFVLAATHRSHY